MLLRPEARFELAMDLQSSQGTEIGSVFSFASPLYFHGKLTYAKAFARAVPGATSVLLITPGLGLIPPETKVTAEQMRSVCRVPVDENDAAYAEPMRRDAKLLEKSMPKDAPVVLLGSVASTKYTAILSAVFGTRLLFPTDFVGRGAMSRGGLLLRSARAGTELPYAPVQTTVVKGRRPPRLRHD